MERVACTHSGCTSTSAERIREPYQRPTRISLWQSSTKASLPGAWIALYQCDQGHKFEAELPKADPPIGPDG